LRRCLLWLVGAWTLFCLFVLVGTSGPFFVSRSRPRFPPSRPYPLFLQRLRARRPGGLAPLPSTQFAVLPGFRLFSFLGRGWVSFSMSFVTVDSVSLFGRRVVLGRSPPRGVYFRRLRGSTLAALAVSDYPLVMVTLYQSTLMCRTVLSASFFRHPSTVPA